MTSQKIPSRAGVRGRASAAPGTTAKPRSRVTRRTQSARPKPKSAYDLLADVARHILEEPKRYNQETFCETGKQYLRDAYGFAPACGTMACRAGWIVALHDGVASVNPVSAEWRAKTILDLDNHSVDVLFSGSHIDRMARRNTSDLIGTLRYAQLGAKGLRAFMRRHAKHLKARLLKDVPTLEGR